MSRLINVSGCVTHGHHHFLHPRIVAWVSYVSNGQTNGLHAILSTRDGQYTCVDCQHSSPIKMTLTTTTSTSTARALTPLPDDTLMEMVSSGFDVVPGETSVRAPTQIDFLAEPWLMSLSHMNHFQLVFLLGHIVGSMVDRQCMTLCPSQFSLENDCITVQYMDCKNAKHTESIFRWHLAPYSPQKGGGSVVFIGGARARLVCSVKKAKCTEGTLDLVTTEQELILKQDRHICCGVEPHVESCHCNTFPPS